MIDGWIIEVLIIDLWFIDYCLLVIGDLLLIIDFETWIEYWLLIQGFSRGSSRIVPFPPTQAREVKRTAWSNISQSEVFVRIFVKHVRSSFMFKECSCCCPQACIEFPPMGALRSWHPIRNAGIPSAV